MGCDGEGEPDVHPARIALDRRVDELLDAREVDDVRELARDLASLHPEDRAVQVDVLPPRELGVEARPDLEQAPDATANLSATRSWRGDPRQNLEQRRLPGAVRADDPKHLALGHVEGDVAQSPDLLALAV